MKEWVRNRVEGFSERLFPVFTTEPPRLITAEDVVQCFSRIHHETMHKGAVFEFKPDAVECLCWIGKDFHKK